MPNRIIRHGILTSEKINRLDWAGEIFYRRLLSVVDDYGRCEAHPTLLRASLYPLKLDRVKEAGLERLLKETEAAALIRTYEVGQKRYLEVLNFGQHQRSPSKFPPPPNSTCDADATQMRSNGSADAEPLRANAPLGVSVSGGVAVVGGEDVSVTRGRARKVSVGSAPGNQPEPVRSRMLEIGTLYNRKAGVRWSAKEQAAFQESGIEQLSTAEWSDQFRPLAAYYRASVAQLREFQGTEGSKDFRRRSLQGLLADWPGQVDRARAWLRVQRKNSADTEAPPPAFN